MLQKAKVAVLGLGATGSVAAELLTRAGIGSIAIIDRDQIELTNLHRQALYTEKDVGKPKAEIAQKALKQINSEIKITSFIMDINHKNIENILKQDLILDCTDNLYTRFLINDYSRKSSTPWIYSACISDHGNVMTITKSTPCFHCIFQEVEGLDTCDTAGILNTVSHSIASLQVQEAVRYLTGHFKEQKHQT